MRSALISLLDSLQAATVIVLTPGGANQTFQLPSAANGSADRLLDKLTDTVPDMQANILEALGKYRMKARQLAERSGYRLTSHFRATLAAMRRAGLLQHDDAGYFRPES